VPDPSDTSQGQSEYGLITTLTLPDGRMLGLDYLSWLADLSLSPLISAWQMPTQTAETNLVQREGEEVHVLAFQLKRPADLFSRYRGEEFALLLPDTYAMG